MNEEIKEKNNIVEDKFGFLNKNNPDILEEDYRVKNPLFDFSKIIDDFKSKVEKIENNSVIGLIGKFGSGKSTMLYQIHKDIKENNENEKWINFDAWKFPERKDLWEGFVLDFARQVNPKFFEKIRKEIDGKQNEDKKRLISVISDFPLLKPIKHFNHFFETTPARRVFEIQDILKNLFNKKIKQKNIFIIVEDIDRSGDKGIYFLETLKNFIKENNFDKRIIIIVPIGKENYSKSSDKIAYSKILDFCWHFDLGELNCRNFLENVFSKNIIKKYKYFIEQMNYLFQVAIKSHNLVIRNLKRILRQANVEYKKISKEEREKLDLRVFILFSFISSFEEKEKIVDTIEEKGVISERIRSDFWGLNFLKMLAFNDKKINLEDLRLKHNFFIYDDDKYLTPIFYGCGFYISNSYFK
jgi:ABC-type dipeptide/oligopeptide/nickel transport system ATPase component